MIGKTLQRFVPAIVLLTVGFGFVANVHAAGLTVEAVNPTPNSLQVYGSKLLFEAAITGGAQAVQWYRLQWDFSYTGGASEGYDTPPVSFQAAANSGQIRYVDNAIQYSALRFVLDPTDPLYINAYHPNASYTYRLLVDACSDPSCGSVLSTAVATGSFSLYDALSFTGYAYAGASTGYCVSTSTGRADLTKTCSTDKDCGTASVCGGDAPGYAAFNCTLNQGVPCSAAYSVLFGLVPGSATRHASFENYAWFGLTDDAQNGAGLGWLTFNKNSCTSGDPDKIGLRCSASVDCGGSGVCTQLADVGSAPVSTDPELWGGQPEINRIYADTETLTDGTIRYPGQASGWARILSVADYGKTLSPVQSDAGWVHLRGGNAPTKICADSSKTCSTDADCSTTGVACGDASNGYVNLAQNGYVQCGDCSTADTYGKSTKCNICAGAQLGSATFCSAGSAATIGKACASPSDCAVNGETNGVCEVPAPSYACNSCYDCTTTNGTTTCSSCQVCSQYGVSLDQQRGQAVGYAWSGGESADTIPGLGWIRFNPSGGVTILQGWLATRYGDIFSGGNVQSKGIPPSNAFNATYVIQANGNISFTSQFGAGDTSYIRQFYPTTIPVPSQATQYINILGRINFSDLVDGVTAATPKKTHRYGTTQWITHLQDIPGWTVDAGTLKLPLNGTDYYYQGDLTIPDSADYQNVEIEAGTHANTGALLTNGSGTLIVDGKLTLNGNVTYASTVVGNILEIPSVGWLVRGDIFVDPNVASLVGAFFVLGCPGDNTILCGSQKTGNIHTGYSVTTPLVVNGLMMAKSFTFERNVLSSAGANGSEQVIYDGRFIANPPPGLQDLSAALPALRLDVPQ